ncbi:MSHA biogenesis protein MshI [hydrothermal vent metagenome]|uniref:MSHA biogenesis protein MshI n=1 Tax=hydrothermal vent metagenome TaxID=652676 RepID=A0A3B0ZC18_9ZZZZ
MLEDVDFTDGREINELDNALHDWVDQYDLKQLSTNFVLAADEANIMLTEAPEVTDSELQQAMRWKLKANSEINIKDSVIDCISIPGQRERGRQAMAYVVTASTDLLKSYVRIVEKSQLNLKSIDINALALRNIAHLLPEDKYGVAFLQLDPNSGLLSLSREGSLFLARDIDVGYQQIVSMGSSKNTSLKIEDSVGMQASLENIVLEVQRSLDYYERYFAQTPIQTLVLAPLPAEVPGVVEYISGQLGVNVYELDLNNILTMKNRKLERGLQTKYLPAIGAALRFSYTGT